MAVWTNDTTLNDEYDAGAVAKASSMKALNENVRAAAERVASAPRSLPLIEAFTTTGATTWTVPTGVTRIKVIVTGGGGGQSVAGGASSVTTLLNTVTANGGGSGNGGAGGTSSGGDINMSGGEGNSGGASDTMGIGGSTYWGSGCSHTGFNGAVGGGFGGGGAQDAGSLGFGHGGAGTSIAVLSVTEGEDIDIVVGAGAASTVSGLDGIVVIEH